MRMLCSCHNRNKDNTFFYLKVFATSSFFNNRHWFVLFRQSYLGCMNTNLNQCTVLTDMLWHIFHVASQERNVCPYTTAILYRIDWMPMVNARWADRNIIEKYWCGKNKLYWQGCFHIVDACLFTVVSVRILHSFIAIT